MIKDLVLKAIFIPLLGICLPILSGLISYRLYSVTELIAANVLFILTSYAIWAGCNWIHIRLRPLYRPINNVPSKILAVCLVSAVYGASTGWLSSMIWMELSREVFTWNGIVRFIAASVAAVILFTLIYEILFLNKERELDNKVVNQLDKERSQAEWQALANELEPHFIFNSLTTLNHLIRTAPEEALQFNNRLASVYKYMLLNKTKELISLEDEMEFIRSYFYLLHIRHDDKLKLETSLNGSSQHVLLPPGSLQILVENAIKHNDFSETDPLHINISLQQDYLKVSNPVKPRQYSVPSTRIGLKNLGARYMLLTNKSIVVENNRESFTVKLPLINPLPSQGGSEKTAKPC